MSELPRPRTSVSKLRDDSCGKGKGRLYSIGCKWLLCSSSGMGVNRLSDRLTRVLPDESTQRSCFWLAAGGVEWCGPQLKHFKMLFNTNLSLPPPVTNSVCSSLSSC